MSASSIDAEIEGDLLPGETLREYRNRVCPKKRLRCWYARHGLGVLVVGLILFMGFGIGAALSAAPSASAASAARHVTGHRAHYAAKARMLRIAVREGTTAAALGSCNRAVDGGWDCYVTYTWQTETLVDNLVDLIHVKRRHSGQLVLTDSYGSAAVRR